MPADAAYPVALEEIWLDIAMRAANAKTRRAAVEKLEASAGALSDAFTTGREPDFAGYAANRRALAAYGLFFFPRTFVRTFMALRECGARKTLKVRRIVDLGAGTGAAGFAALHHLAARDHDTELHLELVDQSMDALELARAVFTNGRDLWPNARLSIRQADARTWRPTAPPDLIVSSFAVNEWMEEQATLDPLVEWTLRQVRAIRPEGLFLLMEPAQRFAVERMEQLRDRIAAEGLHIVAPCPHHDACPMLALQRGWCHEVRTWRVPESMRWLNRNLQRDIHLLKWSMLAVRNAPAPALGEPWMRIVSPVRREKGKYAFHGCGGDGRLHACEWLTRGLDDAGRQRSDALERGDRVRWSPSKVLGDGETERGEGPPEPFEDPSAS